MNRKSYIIETAGGLRAVWKKFSPLGLYILPAIIIIWVLATGETQVYSLFQSPQSPVEAPTNTPEPPPVEVMPTDTPVPPPTETPLPAPADTTAPTQPTPAVIAPTEILQPQTTQPATQPLTSTLTQPPQATVTAPIKPQGQPAQAEQPADTSGSAGVVVNQAKLIDTVVEWLAWGWICFGAIFLLLALAIFPLLHLRGTYLRQKQK